MIKNASLNVEFSLIWLTRIVLFHIFVALKSKDNAGVI